MSCKSKGQIMKYEYCQWCRNNYPDLVTEKARAILCEFCLGINKKRKKNQTSNFEKVRPGDGIKIDDDQVELF
jgi:hypothetical protein